jgi:hypothetical protein
MLPQQLATLIRVEKYLKRYVRTKLQLINAVIKLHEKIKSEMQKKL